MGRLPSGFFGGSLSGKTTLAKHISAAIYRRYGIKSLVLDPVGDDWGPHAKVFSAAQEDEFWREVWASRRMAIFVDEGTEMIGRDKELIPAFTRIRHLGHIFHVIGHRGDSLLPVMRDQIGTLYLFRQTPKSSEIWQECFACEEIEAATRLKQYEFLICERYDKKTRLPAVRKRMLDLKAPAGSTP